MVSRFGGYTGFRSHLSMLPARHVGVVAMVNAPTGSGLTDAIAAYVYDLALGRHDAEARGTARLDSLGARLPVFRQRTAQARADAAKRQQERLVRAPADYTGRYETRRMVRCLLAKGRADCTFDGECWKRRSPVRRREKPIDGGSADGTDGHHVPFPQFGAGDRYRHRREDLAGSPLMRGRSARIMRGCHRPPDHQSSRRSSSSITAISGLENHVPRR